ncbi:hypothetical protein AMK16_00180 [Streptomyces sp. CB00455]|uniref:hypothetical protein n=1 Tax=Streptomyces sp. CB00455 TaxID=1703927 RepID=UPI00095F8741|nr:hypothetical protein [Streptomyces sp. CB00455]OKK21764.1 hypothetical protein AMK16_00180 [Streptomyces sp. CB00455]
MKIKRLMRGVTVSSALVGAVVFAASPAYAADLSISLPSGRGSMYYTDNGDVFTTCDNKADGHGVTGQLYQWAYSGAARQTIRSWEDGGDEGCSVHPYDVGFGSMYQMHLCWNGGGCVDSRVFQE